MELALEKGLRIHERMRKINPRLVYEKTNNKITGTANTANITIKHGF